MISALQRAPETRGEASSIGGPLTQVSRQAFRGRQQRTIRFPTRKLFVGVIARKLERPINLEHKYKVGQIVMLTPSVFRAAALGEYEIRQTMPAPDINSASPRYRIKSVAEIHERIVVESELTLPEGNSEVIRGGNRTNWSQQISSATRVRRREAERFA